MDADMSANVLKYLPDDGLQESVRKAWDSGVVLAGDRGMDPNVVRWRVLELEVARKVWIGCWAMLGDVVLDVANCATDPPGGLR
jgi:hypothetical protein